MKQLLIALLALCGVHGLCQSADNHRLIDALVAMPDPGVIYGVVYYDDGAGDGTILSAGKVEDSQLVQLLPQIRDIVELREAAVPLLIECITDTRRTAISFEPSPRKAPHVHGRIKVPRGFVCLDIVSTGYISRIPRLRRERDHR